MEVRRLEQSAHLMPSTVTEDTMAGIVASFVHPQMLRAVLTSPAGGMMVDLIARSGEGGLNVIAGLWSECSTGRDTGDSAIVTRSSNPVARSEPTGRPMKQMSVRGNRSLVVMTRPQSSPLLSRNPVRESD